jgi:hypothetical protein
MKCLGMFSYLDIFCKVSQTPNDLINKTFLDQSVIFPASTLCGLMFGLGKDIRFRVRISKTQDLRYDLGNYVLSSKFDWIMSLNSLSTSKIAHNLLKTKIKPETTFLQNYSN